MNRILKVHPADNVLVALSNLTAGESVKYNGSDIKLTDNIPAKHKFVINDLHAGDSIIMYGVLVESTV
jgi:altronate hydrolase